MRRKRKINNKTMQNNLSSSIVLSTVQSNLYKPQDVFEQSRVTRLEHIPTTICENAKEGARQVADEIANLIITKQKHFEKAVISLVSGHSMDDIFAELVRWHTQKGLSFKNVVIINLFEYYPLTDKQHSCYHQIEEQLLSQVDIDPKNVLTLDGQIDKSRVMSHCLDIEKKVEALGGVDYQLLGIGRGGNIGFNQPGSSFTSTTRLVVLDELSRQEAKSIFGTVDQVPISAVTIGIGSILKAKQITLVAWGEHKADQVKQAIENEPSTNCPASALQTHMNAHVVLDLRAAAQLTRINHPWLLTSCEWTPALTRRAIVWLCEKTNKPILKLTNRDYNDNSLGELVALYGSAYNCNIKVFNDIQHTITGWPGGKPNADDSNRPERAKPYPKDILIFSPHPDDDVISMGGTFARLIKQGHNVHIAYETSGCIAVGDENLQYFLDFIQGLSALPCQKSNSSALEAINKAFATLTQRDVLDLKALIRRGEATAADRYMGLKEDHIHFLNLPFYETGTIKKNDLSQADVDIVKKLLLEFKPQEIFAAGDLADPHGTHKVCLDAVLAAIDELKDTEDWLKDCRIWMYRGAWMEWEVDLIEMAVPLSPEELRFKRNTILKHQSQMESAPFMGDDERLFWQRAEDRNQATADLYARLGLANYEAIEAFVQYKLTTTN